MTQPNDVNYSLAAALVGSGQWSVDPDVGLVYGKRGRSFTRRNSWGYVQIKFRDPDNWRVERAVLAHRVIWEHEHGPILAGLTINHLNGVKTDNRIANLECVTLTENMRHARRTGLLRARQSEDMPTAKLTNEQAREVYRRAWTGEDQSRIAKDFGIGRITVSHIKVGRAYKSATSRAA